MPKDREPYNSKYCKEVDCSKRSGNKCTVVVWECVHNHKRIVYWEIHGELLPEDIEDG